LLSLSAHNPLKTLNSGKEKKGKERKRARKQAPSGRE
jgi:hypothetical protein